MGLNIDKSMPLFITSTLYCLKNEELTNSFNQFDGVTIVKLVKPENNLFFNLYSLLVVSKYSLG